MMFGRDYFGNFGCYNYGFFGGSIWGIFIIVGIVLLAIALIIYFSKRKSEKNINGMEFEILKLKYVKGEITEEEYLKKKSILERK